MPQAKKEHYLAMFDGKLSAERGVSSYQPRDDGSHIFIMNPIIMNGGTWMPFLTMGIILSPPFITETLLPNLPYPRFSSLFICPTEPKKNAIS